MEHTLEELYPHQSQEEEAEECEDAEVEQRQS